MGGELRRRLRALQEELVHAERSADTPRAVLRALQERVEALQRRVRRIPFLDPLDLRFRNRVRIPQPTAKAVMFCLMDVSGSMDEERKDIAKRFFILLYLFLMRHYEKTDVIFIRHHTQATEVSEAEFFEATETGGTVVSSALVLMHDIIQARYPGSDWNIYGAQASDGENWHNDSARCGELLLDKLLPVLRYFAYVQVAGDEQSLWEEYTRVKEREPKFAMSRVTSASDIYLVFRELFAKTGTA